MSQETASFRCFGEIIGLVISIQTSAFEGFVDPLRNLTDMLSPLENRGETDT